MQHGCLCNYAEDNPRLLWGIISRRGDHILYWFLEALYEKVCDNKQEQDLWLSWGP